MKTPPKVTVRSPDEIRDDILARLFWDNRIDASDIKVDVTGGAVMLKGTVPSYSARLFAGRDAFLTPGVRLVDNRLSVSYAATIPPPDDSEIRFHIENTLAWNSSIDATRVEVSVADGVVELSGYIHSLWQKARVEEIAAEVKGVQSVKSRLIVTPVRPRRDEDIEKDITERISRDTDIELCPLKIKVENSVVTLSGTVRDWGEYSVVEETALYTGGVTAVNNFLAIEPETSRL